MLYKDKVQEIAERIAQRKFECEFYDLSEEDQNDVWHEAEVEYAERRQEAADLMREEMEVSRDE